MSAKEIITGQGKPVTPNSLELEEGVFLLQFTPLSH